MKRLDQLFRALDRAGVRYVIVGGLAVILRGHVRMTIDTDLIVDLEPAAALRAVETLLALGLQPRNPGDPRLFADPAVRRDWTENRNMKVFSWLDPEHPLRVIDIFVSHSIPFDELWSRAGELMLERTKVRVASIVDLIRLKSMAGREQDLRDIQALEALMAKEEAGRG